MSDDDTNLVRPYLITGGRTRATSAELSIETIVTTADKCPVDDLGLERRRIAELCHEPRSIAEVAGRLDVPLAVARILVSELAAGGFVVAHGTVSDQDVTLLEELIEGIRGL
ncbi:MAG: DUF742 domain-containing protein [Acidimicrobiales bacterium]